MLPGITLVISPLISLIKDQVMALRSAGVSDAYLNSSLTSEQIRTVYRQLRDGAYRIVYVAPERLAGDGFVSLMQKLDVSFVAVDEAHCIYDNRQMFVVGAEYEFGKERYLITDFSFGFHLIRQSGTEIF